VPLAFAFQLQWLPPVVSGALAFLWIAATAIVGAMFVPERIAARALAYVVYPIALTLYPLALVGVSAPWPVDFFEDGHDFVVASGMVRGETPYADILPTHGFLADGGLDFLFMKSGADTMGKVLHMRTAVAALNLAAMYFIAFAATGAAPPDASASCSRSASFRRRRSGCGRCRRSSAWPRSPPQCDCVLCAGLRSPERRLRCRS